MAVLPEVEDVQIETRNEDLKSTRIVQAGAGGQHVNTTDSQYVLPIYQLVSLQHLLRSKSQIQNREKAMKVLYVYYMKVQEQQKYASQRKSAVGYR
ncbi:peptide chain release factor-like protein [Staphylococcus aureus]